MQLVVGAGAIGSATASLLASSGEQVRLVTRSGTGPTHPGIERVAAAASDAATLRRLARGASVVYNCANPQYHQWPEVWPPLAAALLGAAESAGAVLAITGNLYVYGPVDRPMTEDMPLAAPTVKGKVRVRMWNDALAAHRAGRVRVVEARASDFISPKHSLVEMTLPALRAGKTVRLPMPLDIPHSFTYTEDVARTLITLAGDERAWGQAWHVPTAAPMTAREFAQRIARVGNFPSPRLSRYPEIAVRAAGLFEKFARDYIVLSYQFKRPFVLDSSRAEQTFGLRPTDVDEAIRVTLGQPAAGQTSKGIPSKSTSE
jgi:nucleoside-diphosphate-sugar epimerase